MKKVPLKLHLMVLTITAFALVSTIPSVYAEDEEKKCTVKDICFERTTVIDGEKYILQGTAIHKHWGFKVYSAAFYTQKNVSTIEEALSAINKLLVLKYHRDVKKNQIIENSDYILEKNPKYNREEINPELIQLYSHYRNVTKGDSFALLFVKKSDTTLLFNDEEKVSVKGLNFQKAYFGIWLSKYSVGTEFTEKLIKGEKPEVDTKVDGMIDTKAKAKPVAATP